MSAMCDAITPVHGTPYDYGSICSWFGLASGGSIDTTVSATSRAAFDPRVAVAASARDPASLANANPRWFWQYTDLGIVHSYAAELRDTGQFGFLVPFSQVEDTAQETMAGVLALGEHILAQRKAAERSQQ